MENRWMRIYQKTKEQNLKCMDLKEQLQGYDYLTKLHYNAVKELQQLEKKKVLFSDFFPQRNSKRRLKTEKRLHKIAVLKVKVEDLEERVDYYRTLRGSYDGECEKLQFMRRELEECSIQILDLKKGEYPSYYEEFWNAKKEEEKIEQVLELIKHALWELEGAKDIEEMNLIGGSIAQIVIDDHLISVEADVVQMIEIVTALSKGEHWNTVLNEILLMIHSPVNLDREKKLTEMNEKFEKLAKELDGECSLIWDKRVKEVLKLIEISIEGFNCETTV